MLRSFLSGASGADDGGRGAAERLADIEGTLALAGGFAVAPAVLSEDAESEAGSTGGIQWEPDESLVNERGLLAPSALGVQLPDGVLGDPPCIFDTLSLQQVVAGLQ
jgi:hypothetical protein